jgi:hypothetical protein
MFLNEFDLQHASTVCIARITYLPVEMNAILALRLRLRQEMLCCIGALQDFLLKMLKGTIVNAEGCRRFFQAHLLAPMDHITVQMLGINPNTFRPQG